jgi:hypothetical protein
MITENDVRDAASRFLDGVDFWVRRSTGGFSKPCGYEVKIVDDIPGSVHTLFVHETNDSRSLISKMIEFSENALNPI